ncbi:MAG TPA: hypothetical protein VGU68_18325 [Ktedonobacteraceae bacterium]|nr:hypothetical protein [Ktedonobacteraceae bacterium]
MKKAEDLAAHIDTLAEGAEKMRLTYRWATIVDEVALLMVQIEEQFSEQELTSLQGTVNEHDQHRWDSYRRNIRWLNRRAEE